MTDRAPEEIKRDLESLKQHLLQEKDEIKVQIELAKMEAKAEWRKVEHQWDDFVAKLKAAAESVEDVAEEAVEAVETIGEDLKERFKDLKEKLKD